MVEPGRCTSSRQNIAGRERSIGTYTQKLSSSCGGWKLPRIISLACGAAVPTPLTPLIQMPSLLSLTIARRRPIGRRDVRGGSRRARAVALRVDDRLGEMDVVLLEVLDVASGCSPRTPVQSRWKLGSSASIPSGSVAIMSMPRPCVPQVLRATYLMPSRRKRRSSLVRGMR